ncbi:aspartic proteinase II-1 [Myriangium duriaei CBS 260.36]|uniref:Aspartic proteinase II-1 n=1 Tax=Myriangium duriaei CBS 260.36 TaxID=1168546 RepID=A0A9P4MSD1_9PEZI|nr:aspartic proteinase II-1 [Myriangium duriaei CBS 260.36]
MHLPASLYIASTLAGIAVAVPANAHPKTFSIKQQKVTKDTKLVPAQHILRTYQKFNVKAPSQIKSAAAAAQTGSVAANNVPYDVAYISPVTIGSQTFNLDFDTGSSDLWVFGSGLSSSAQSGHTIYNPGSTASLLSGQTWSIGYGDGSGAKGVVYSDKVVVGGVTATKQAVEAATSVSSSFVQDTSNSGLLGLAFSNINTVRPTQQTTFFDSVKSSLAAQLFTTSLKKGAAGTYDFGYIDTSKYTGAISYVPISTRNGFWEFSAGNYTVGSTRFTGTIGEGIADTGTTLLYLPTKVVSNYYAQVKGATLSQKYGGWVFPCSTTLPNFLVNLGGTYFTLPGSYINFSYVSNTMCFGGMQPNTGIGFSIFGDIFLKSAFVIWDQTQSTPRLGFAKPT